MSSLARQALLLTVLASCGGDEGAHESTARVLIDTPRDSADLSAVPAPPPPTRDALGDTALGRAPSGDDAAPNATASIGTSSPPFPPTPAPQPPERAREDTVSETPPPAAPEPAPPASQLPPPPARPFAVGERLAYDVRFGPIRLGRATMELRALTEVRGEPAYHAVFAVTGGNALYRVDDHYESWFSSRTGASLRYEQRIDQGSYERRRRFEIFPERRTYREEGKPGEEPSVAAPLDEASFLYFLRTVPLEVGRTYTFDRYFRPDRNPVTVRVLRREAVTVPAGTFDAVVVQPTIKTPGIFSEGGRAEVWFADDSTRRILQIRSRLKFGTISLHLR